MPLHGAANPPTLRIENRGQCLVGITGKRVERRISVLIDRLDGLKVGKKVELHTNIGSFMVRIVYINKVVPPRNAAPAVTLGSGWG